MAAAPAPAKAAPSIPFRYGTRPMRTPMDARGWNYTQSAGGGLIQPWDLPRQGYAKRILAFLNGSVVQGATPATLQEDYPHSVAKLISLKDPAGSPIIQLSGFQAYLLSRILNPRPGNDVAASGDATLYAAANAASSTNVIADVFSLPICVNDRDTLGALPNQDSKRGYSLEITSEAVATLFTANTPTSETFTFTPVYEYLPPPPPADPFTKLPYGQNPPHLYAVHKAHTERWNIGSTGSRAIVAHLKTGDTYRGIGLTFRSNGTRATAASTPWTAIRCFYGNNILYKEYTSEAQLRRDQYELLGVTLPAGCYFIDFTSDSGLRPGLDGRRDYFNTRLLTDVWIEVDLPAGYNTTNAYLEVLEDTVQLPAGMTLM